MTLDSFLPPLRKAAYFTAFVALSMLLGCGEPILEITDPQPRHYAAVPTYLSAPLSRSRNLPQYEQLSAVNRVLPQIRETAFHECQKLNLPLERCRLMKSANVWVNPANPEINAHADQHDHIHLYGGLIRVTGTDAEIAAVLAHEFAHVMFGHVQKVQQNALTGMIIAGGLAGLVAAQTDTDPNEFLEDSMKIGQTMGGLVYRPSMEIEADRIAVYILAGAGFPASAMRDFIVRLTQMQAHAKAVRSPVRIGFLDTHPSDEKRVAHILSGIEAVESGFPLILR